MYELVRICFPLFRKEHLRTRTASLAPSAHVQLPESAIPDTAPEPVLQSAITLRVSSVTAVLNAGTNQI